MNRENTYKGLVVTAVVLAVAAIGLSGYLLYLQDDEVGRLREDIADLKADIDRLTRTVDRQDDEIAALEVTLQSTASGEDRISSVESSIRDLDGDLSRITDYVEELGHCLLLEAEGGAYTYWTGTEFPLFGIGFQDVIERCQ